MRKRFLFGLLLLPLAAIAQTIDSVPGKMQASDHGRVKSFIVSTEEVARKQLDGRFKVVRGSFAKATKDQTSQSEMRIVLYPEGKARTESNQRLLTEKMVVELRPGSDVAAVAGRLGIIKWEVTAALENHYIFTANSALAAMKMIETVRADSQVVSADFLLARQQKLRGKPNDPLFSLQWHLLNTGKNGGLRGIDAGTVSAWGNFNGAGYRGKGVVIGIVDDGVQFTHPDIKPNYDVTLDYDWNDNTPLDPTPSEANEDYHGTSVAGVAAARGGNLLGVCGVAPQARLTGLRLVASFADDSQEGAAFVYKAAKISVKNNSWGPEDDGQTMEKPGPIASQALKNAVANGRNGRGTIFVWAAGNGRAEGDDSNYDGYANSIYTIAVTAINNRGKVTYYGEGGANVLVGAPSDDAANSGIVTTDLSGNNGYNYIGATGELGDTNYTRTFGGTSSATPVVSGVVALMLQRNPRLGWRDVQEILIRSATLNDPLNKFWIYNAAGFHFNKDFGAGLVNGSKAVRFAGNWANLGPQTAQSQTDATAETIPDGAGAVVRSFAFPNAQRVEHVTVRLNIEHAFRGQLHITLTSPSGTVSELASRHNDSSADIDWTYMTVRNWGESSAGVWTLRVEDQAAGAVGTLKSAEVTLYGTNVPLM